MQLAHTPKPPFQSSPEKLHNPCLVYPRLSILQLMQRCWAHEPAERPSFNAVAAQLRCVAELAGCLPCTMWVQANGLVKDGMLCCAVLQVANP